MAARDYWLVFGSGNPALKSGLSPTFITFVDGTGATLAPPSITETYVGTGLYKFSYEATLTIAFTCDGATTGLSTSDRYIVGVLDPQDWMGQRLGFTTSTFGNNTTDPGTVFGFLKRAQETWEGNENYAKATGILDIYSRGSSTLLRSKTISDTASDVTKT